MTDKIYSIDEIKNIVAPIAARYGVERVFLFGSYARGEATPESDLDFLVDAPSFRSLLDYGGLYADFEDVFNKELDLVSLTSLKYNKDKLFLHNLRKDACVIYETN